MSRRPLDPPAETGSTLHFEELEPLATTPRHLAASSVHLAHHEHHHEHEHHHHHEHTHAHAEPGAHTHEHSLPPPSASPNSPLAQGAGAGKTLLFDLPSGIAGDMTIAALVDLGVPFEVVVQAVGKLQLHGYELSLLPARASVIGGSRFEVHVTAPQPERRYADIDALLANAALEPLTQQLARRIFRHLATAESEVHRVPMAEIAFHEVGAIDAIVDIVGAAACIAHLGARVVATPLPIGRGSVMCQHGALPLPAPATLLCLRGVPTYDSGRDVELVTPTGAAIIAAVAEEFVSWPSLTPERVGWGCGSMQLPGIPNAVRAVLGSPGPRVEATLASHVL
ncbi:MAG TPA: LarC family nickel insertion protein, partial [Polyangiaceae bacterium]|nr:LarC family nickel insertion protein [Polyangiaceae bacterium]